VSGTFNGKSAFATGAGRGIDVATARDFARNGAKVGITRLNMDAARNGESAGGKITNAVSIAAKQGYSRFAYRHTSRFIVTAMTEAAVRAPCTDRNAVGASVPSIVCTEPLDHAFMSFGLIGRPGQAINGLSQSILIHRRSRSKNIIDVATCPASKAVRSRDRANPHSRARNITAVNANTKGEPR
jgi:hypothetical protein